MNRAESPSPRSESTAATSSGILKQKIEGKRIARQRLEPGIPTVKVRCAVVFGMHDQRTNAQRVRGIQDAVDRVKEQTSAKTLALGGFVHRQAGQQGDRNWVAGRALGEAFARALVQHLARRQRVIAEHDMAAVAGDEGARIACLVVSQRESPQIRI